MTFICYSSLPHHFMSKTLMMLISSYTDPIKASKVYWPPTEQFLNGITLSWFQMKQKFKKSLIEKVFLKLKSLVLFQETLQIWNADHNSVKLPSESIIPYGSIIHQHLKKEKFKILWTFQNWLVIALLGVLTKVFTTLSTEPIKNVCESFLLSMIPKQYKTKNIQTKHLVSLINFGTKKKDKLYWRRSSKEVLGERSS